MVLWLLLFLYNILLSIEHFVLSFEHLRGYKLCLVLVFCLAIDIVGEEEEFEHQKDDHKFDEDDGPKGLAKGHRPKSIIIEMEYLV